MALTIFYDDACVICRTEMMRFYRVYPNEMNLISLSQPTPLLAQYSVSLEAALDLLHVVDEQDKLYVGMAAVRLVYRRLGKPKTAVFTSLPLLRGFFDRLYPVVARHRYRLPLWLLGVGVKDAASVCHDGYCQLNNQQKASLIRKSNDEHD